MNDECIGIVGKIFGHKFESMIESYTLNSKITEMVVGRAMESLSREGGTFNFPYFGSSTYKIVCKRCGKIK